MLSNRAQITLKRIKAQLGLVAGYKEEDSPLGYVNLANAKDIPTLIGAPGTSTAGVPFKMNNPPQPATSVGSSNTDTSGTPFGEMISPILQVGMGIKNLIDAGKHRREQRAFERNSREDYKQRKEEARANNFYLTPYTTGRTDKLTAKKGLKIHYQNGGSVDLMDAFMNFYNQQQDQSDETLRRLDENYRDKNEQLTNQWKQEKSQGAGNIFKGGLSIASKFLQQGGIIPESTYVNPTPNMEGNKPLDTLELELRKRKNESWHKNIVPEAESQFISDITKDLQQFKDVQKIRYGVYPSNIVVGTPKKKFRFHEKQEGGEIVDTESLYSKDFVSPVQQIDSPEESMMNNSSLAQWLFEEEPLQTHTLSDIYDQRYSNTRRPIDDVLEKFKSMGLNPSSIDEGRHNTGSAHYEGKALDLGLNTTFKGDQDAMDKFLGFLSSSEGKKQFPNIRVLDERNRPVGQKVWSGSHLHIEVTD